MKGHHDLPSFIAHIHLRTFWHQRPWTRFQRDIEHSHPNAELAAVTGRHPRQTEPSPAAEARAGTGPAVSSAGRPNDYDASALYAGVWAFPFIFPGGGDNFATFGLFWMSALIYFNYQRQRRRQSQAFSLKA
jgi:hypothetical protein